ncbi:lysophospholipid acyltransferase family protein [Chloroflexota bacterium]
MPWYYYLAGLIVRMLLRLFTRWQVKGRENIPNQGPLLVVANHVNLVDVPLLGASFDRRVIFMAKKELFHFRLIGHVIGSFGAFPVHRGQLDRKALRQANRVLADGQTLITFPEGTRSHSGRLGHAFPGSALIALRSGAPILPVGITGTENIKGIAWILHRPQITVTFGYPFHLPPVNGKLSKTELAESTNCMMKHIAELLPTKYQGVYV